MAGDGLGLPLAFGQDEIGRGQVGAEAGAADDEADAAARAVEGFQAMRDDVVVHALEQHDVRRVGAQPFHPGRRALAVGLQARRVGGEVEEGRAAFGLRDARRRGGLGPEHGGVMAEGAKLRRQQALASLAIELRCGAAKDEAKLHGPARAASAASTMSSGSGSTERTMVRSSGAGGSSVANWLAIRLGGMKWSGRAAWRAPISAGSPLR